MQDNDTDDKYAGNKTQKIKSHKVQRNKDYLESAIERVLPLLDKFQDDTLDTLDCARINKNVTKCKIIINIFNKKNKIIK